jgi:hypothetical protein
MQAAGGQLREYQPVCAGHAARGIDIFDAHQPLAPVRTGV